jgi:hypothetical protein
MSPNNRMQRTGMHKVLGRGRDASARKIFMLARVPTGRRAGADAGRSATLVLGVRQDQSVPHTSR